MPEEIGNFEVLWSYQTSRLRVIDFTEASKELLLRYRLDHESALHDDTVEYCIPNRDMKPGTVPCDLELCDYQKPPSVNG